jgi:hypothetical protein
VPLPQCFEHRLLLAEQTAEGLVERIERGPPAARGSHFVPRFVREPLHVVGKVAGELDDRVAEAVFRLDSRSLEPHVDGRREFVGRNLLEAHHGPGFIERPFRPEHPFHQRRLGAGEHVADIALMLYGRAHRGLDRAAVELADGLKLVESDDDLPPPRVREPAGEREHVLRQA